MGDLAMRLARPFFRRQARSLMQRTSAEAAEFNGFPVLILTTIGAKTGKERVSVLGGFPDGEESWLIVASKGGSRTHPAWFLNLAANPDKVWCQIGNRKFRADVVSLSGAERDAAYERVAARAPVYAAYPKKTDREIPVILITPAA